MAEHPNQIELPPNARDNEDAAEILRAWIVGGGLEVSLWPAFDEPEVWGVLLVDIARHVARMYADRGDVSEEQALAAVRKMFDAEWNRPTDLGTTRARN
jgi:Domain of unknown function (DUF5076)